MRPWTHTCHALPLRVRARILIRRHHRAAAPQAPRLRYSWTHSRWNQRSPACADGGCQLAVGTLRISASSCLRFTRLILGIRPARCREFPLHTLERSCKNTRWPEQVANLTSGDMDIQTLYITTSVYGSRRKARGFVPYLLRAYHQPLRISTQTIVGGGSRLGWDRCH
jgi:hypothetical protein